MKRWPNYLLWFIIGEAVSYVIMRDMDVTVPKRFLFAVIIGVVLSAVVNSILEFSGQSFHLPQLWQFILLVGFIMNVLFLPTIILLLVFTSYSAATTATIATVILVAVSVPTGYYFFRKQEMDNDPLGIRPYVNRK